MATASGQFRVGTSGYQYDHWGEKFYPDDLSKKHWFAHYAQYFDTVEINNTFYRLPSAKAFDAWRKQAPPEFCYVLKFSRDLPREAPERSALHDQKVSPKRPVD